MSSDHPILLNYLSHHFYNSQVLALKHLLVLFPILSGFILHGYVAVQEVFAQEGHVFHGSKIAAGFHVELTVDPTPIEPGVLTKIGTVFRDVATGEPASKVPHTLVLTQDSRMIFRESTDSANYMHEFMFMEEHKGQLTVLIENVNNSGQNVEFSLTVVPEFPFSTMLAFAATIGVAFAILRAKGATTLRI